MSGAKRGKSRRNYVWPIGQTYLQTLTYRYLAEAIGALPQGYDTPCTPDIFSQGQWQLLSIARAVAADPKLLLLDEITANLDAETERAVLRALKRATADRTVLSISHRVGADTGRLIPIGEES